MHGVSITLPLTVFPLGFTFLLNEELGFVGVGGAHSLLILASHLTRVANTITLFRQKLCRLLAIARLSRALCRSGIVMDLWVFLRILRQDRTANRQK